MRDCSRTRVGCFFDCRHECSATSPVPKRHCAGEHFSPFARLLKGQQRGSKGQILERRRPHPNLAKGKRRGVASDAWEDRKSRRTATYGTRVDRPARIFATTAGGRDDQNA